MYGRWLLLPRLVVAAVVVVDFVFRAEFECSLAIQSTQATTAGSHCANNDAWEGSN